jgi:putative flippase GtrA
MKRRFVFSRPKKIKVLKSMSRYYALAAAILALNYGLLYVLHIVFVIPIVPAKLATECLLFAISYWFQRKFVY